MLSRGNEPLTATDLQEWPALASYLEALARFTPGEIHCHRGEPDPEDQCAAAAGSISLRRGDEIWRVHVVRAAANDGRPAWREPALVRMLAAMQENLSGRKALSVWPSAVRTAWQLATTHPCRAMSLGEVAACVDLSPGYLGEQFEQVTGSSFKRILRDERMAYACGVLEGTDQRISELAGKIGGLSLSQFNRSFVLATGLTPSNWRRMFSHRRNARPSLQ